jgi:hypothetical protein
MPGRKWNVVARHVHALTFASAGAAKDDDASTGSARDAPMAAEHQ